MREWSRGGFAPFELKENKNKIKFISGGKDEQMAKRHSSPNILFLMVSIYCADGEIDMQREFMHLTTTDDKEEEGAATKKRVFEPDRSRRLHWIRYHIEERTSHVLEIFSCEERDIKHRKNIYRTYVYDKIEKYVIVLEPQRSPHGYYLLTAYYLNMPGGEKKIKKMLKKKLNEVL